jgi:predicted RNA-binding Zn-ribbon protein involved in translation (DUF1610 family)
MNENIDTENKKTKRINSKQKGKRGELDWRNFLWQQGFTNAYRSQQYCGSSDSADVICPELPNIHHEVKYTQKLNLYDAMGQAAKDCGDKTPIVAHRKNNHDWLVIMRGEDWMNLIKETDHVKTIFCPDCKQANVNRHGTTDKIKQRYLCVNPDCGRSFIVE